VAAQFPNWQKQERVLTRRAGVVLGVSLSMLFDGIVLHQLLQWHHLVSRVSPAGHLSAMQFNTFWDGVFHASAYVLLVIGLLLLWRLATFVEPAKVRKQLFAYVLIGFGGFNIVDSIVNHWVLQLHHVRDGVANWWIYDIAFFLVAGVAIAGAGWYLLHSQPSLMPKR
jgi:uncharacterized membrane protein